MLKFRLDRLSLEKLFLSFIRPLLEYGDVVWDPHNVNLINTWKRFKLKRRGSYRVGQNQLPDRNYVRKPGY